MAERHVEESLLNALHIVANNWSVFRINTMCFEFPKHLIPMQATLCKLVNFGSFQHQMLLQQVQQDHHCHVEGSPAAVNEITAACLRQTLGTEHPCFFLRIADMPTVIRKANIHCMNLHKLSIHHHSCGLQLKLSAAGVPLDGCIGTTCTLSD
jgi:hypothetical protein